MTLRASTLALVAASSLLAPAAAEAKHRHSRSCGHYDGYRGSGYGHDYRYGGDYGRRYDRHRGRGYGHYPRYGHRYYAPRYYYDDYGYHAPRYYYDDYYGYYPRYRYYHEPVVALHFHSGRPCRRFHLGLHFGF